MQVPRGYLKILVSGPFASGKTTFVKTVSQYMLQTEVPISSSREASVKQYTTVAFDYGKLSLDGYDVYLFGTPGQTRLQFMWKVLATGMHGYIFMVDGSSLVEVVRGKTLYEFMKTLGDYPHIIAVNKQDVKGAIPPAKVAEIFGVRPSVVAPLIAYNKDYGLQLLRKLVKLVLSGSFAEIESQQFVY
uniref:GTP-binding protein n=1 Tax=Thermofilum pendens TaxID=2269 RepID=A0A7C3WTL3_THEPE